MEDNKEVLLNEESETANLEINEESEHESEIDVLNEKISELTDKYLRTVAELENTRRRAALDAESTSRNRAMGIAANFLPLIDAINAAIIHASDDQGIKTLVRAAENTLTQLGITKIETIGQTLNPKFHNAISIVEKPNENVQSDTIISEMQTGYMFGENVLRVAIVSVCK